MNLLASEAFYSLLFFFFYIKQYYLKIDLIKKHNICILCQKGNVSVSFLFFLLLHMNRLTSFIFYSQTNIISCEAGQIYSTPVQVSI